MSIWLPCIDIYLFIAGCFCKTITLAFDDAAMKSGRHFDGKLTLIWKSLRRNSVFKPVVIGF